MTTHARMLRAHGIQLRLAVLFLVSIGLLWGAPVLAQDIQDIDILFGEWQVMTLEEPLEAPDFSLVSMDDETKTLEDFQGRLVFLNFWTTW